MASLIWRALAPAVSSAVPASGSRASMQLLAQASLQGTARAEGDRTWESIRQASSVASSLRTKAFAAAGFNGSCTCLCPPSQGFGKCFEGTSTHEIPPGGACPASLLASVPLASAYCPRVAQPVQCLPEQVGESVCPKPAWVTGPSLSKCSMVPGATQLATASCEYAPGAGSGSAGIGEWEYCSWQPAPCIYSPFFPP